MASPTGSAQVISRITQILDSCSGSLANISVRHALKDLLHSLADFGRIASNSYNGVTDRLPYTADTLFTSLTLGLTDTLTSLERNPCLQWSDKETNSGQRNGYIDGTRMRDDHTKMQTLKPMLSYYNYIIQMLTEALPVLISLPNYERFADINDTLHYLRLDHPDCRQNVDGSQALGELLRILRRFFQCRQPPGSNSHSMGMFYESQTKEGTEIGDSIREKFESEAQPYLLDRQGRLAWRVGHAVYWLKIARGKMKSLDAASRPDHVYADPMDAISIPILKPEVDAFFDLVKSAWLIAEVGTSDYDSATMEMKFFVTYLRLVLISRFQELLSMKRISIEYDDLVYTANFKLSFPRELPPRSIDMGDTRNTAGSQDISSKNIGHLSRFNRAKPEAWLAPPRQSFSLNPPASNTNNLFRSVSMLSNTTEASVDGGVSLKHTYESTGLSSQKTLDLRKFDKIPSPIEDESAPSSFLTISRPNFSNPKLPSAYRHRDALLNTNDFVEDGVFIRTSPVLMTSTVQGASQRIRSRDVGNHLRVSDSSTLPESHDQRERIQTRMQSRKPRQHGASPDDYNVADSVKGNKGKQGGFIPRAETSPAALQSGFNPWFAEGPEQELAERVNSLNLADGEGYSSPDELEERNGLFDRPKGVLRDSRRNRPLSRFPDTKGAEPSSANPLHQEENQFSGVFLGPRSVPPVSTNGSVFFPNYPSRNTPATSIIDNHWPPPGFQSIRPIPPIAELEDSKPVPRPVELEGSAVSGGKTAKHSEPRPFETEINNVECAQGESVGISTQVKGYKPLETRDFRSLGDQPFINSRVRIFKSSSASDGINFRLWVTRRYHEPVELQFGARNTEMVPAYAFSNDKVADLYLKDAGTAKIGLDYRFDPNKTGLLYGFQAALINSYFEAEYHVSCVVFTSKKGDIECASRTRIQFWTQIEPKNHISPAPAENTLNSSYLGATMVLFYLIDQLYVVLISGRVEIPRTRKGKKSTAESRSITILPNSSTRNRAKYLRVRALRGSPSQLPGIPLDLEGLRFTDENTNSLFENYESVKINFYSEEDCGSFQNDFDNHVKRWEGQSKRSIVSRIERQYDLHATGSVQYK